MLIPPDIEAQAFRRGVDWFKSSGLVILRKDMKPGQVGWRVDVPYPTLSPGEKVIGNGKLGLMEGFASTIRLDGSQTVLAGVRNDCNGESRMAFAFGGTLLGEPFCKSVAANLNDFTYTGSPLAQGPRADPKSPSFGLVGWALGGHEATYYGDDNARSLLGTMAVSALLKTDRWNEFLLRCTLANLRTSGRYGFRGNALNEQGHLRVHRPARGRGGYRSAAFQRCRSEAVASCPSGIRRRVRRHGSSSTRS
jgi:hypothetical protein